MKKLLTLCLIHQGNRVLLGMKKRGKGMGHWNGFGGKVEVGETIEDAAVREVSEESGVHVASIEKMGIIDFTLPGEDMIWQVHIFRATEFSGHPIETDEMKPQWFEVAAIPYDTMWADDKYWFPLFLQGKKFTGRFMFDDSYTIVEKELNEATILPS